MAKSFKKSHEFLGKRKKLSSIRNFVGDQLKKTPLNNDDIYRMMLAVDEACTNVIVHNYEKNSKDKDNHIKVTVEFASDQVSLIIEDEGEEFNPLDVHDPDLKQHLEEYRKKGLGIFLIRRLVDEVIYHYSTHKGNKVELIKYTDVYELT